MAPWCMPGADGRPFSWRERGPRVPTMGMPPPRLPAAVPAQQLPELITKETVRALEVRAGGWWCRQRAAPHLDWLSAGGVLAVCNPP